VKKDILEQPLPMLGEISPHRPPATQLRPLHSRNENDEASPVVESTWSSSIGLPSDNDATRDAVVRLVSQITILDAGEQFCIQDATLGGYLLACTDQNGQYISHSFVKCESDQGEIPTDFSIGTGKVRHAQKKRKFDCHTDSWFRASSFMLQTVKCD
jgi:hypothetical protein